MESAIPASKIATLSSGEFVGIVADSPNERIELKMFHGAIQNDHEAIAVEEAGYVPLPEIRKVMQEDMQENYNKIKKDVGMIVSEELKKLEAIAEAKKKKAEKNAKDKKRVIKPRAPKKSIQRGRKTMDKQNDQNRRCRCSNLK